MDAFHLMRPLWLLALLPLLWLLLRLFRNLHNENQWQGIVDPALLSSLIEEDDRSPAARWPLWAISILWLLAVVALAGPSWERREAPVYRGLSERVLVVDLSLSMNAKDIKPSRIGRVRQKLHDILDRSGDTQTALVVFAAVPYVVSPLTDDVQTIRSMLPSLTTDIIPAQGGRTTLALEMAGELLSNAKSRQGSIWLFTDSPLDSAAITQARSLAENGYRLSVMGVGSADGAPISMDDGSYVKDGKGNIVVVKLADEPLRNLASAGGGTYTNVTTNDRDVSRLFDRDKSLLPQDTQASDQNRKSEVWLERGPWLLFLLTPLSALVFRRGWL